MKTHESSLIFPSSTKIAVYRIWSTTYFYPNYKEPNIHLTVKMGYVSSLNLVINPLNLVINLQVLVYV